MSWSLVKRSLDLCDDQQNATKNRKVDQVTGGQSSRHQRGKRAARQRKVAQKRQLEVKSLFSHKQGVSALEKYQQSARKDRTLDNIKLLKKIDKKRAPQDYVEKILSQHTKQLERGQGSQGEAQQTHAKKKQQQTQESSVFSEEDFEKMNKEWLKLY